MAEFGHQGIIRSGLCIDTWGTGPFIIAIKGREFRFEDSDRFGPVFIGKHGDVLSNQYLAERSPFWREHRIWVRQGRRLADDGKTCIVDEPRPTYYRKIGRTNFIIQNGDEDGENILVESADSLPSIGGGGA